MAGALALLLAALPVTAASGSESPTATSTPEPPVDLGGQPVTGGGPGDPTTVTAGLWSDTLSGPGQSEATTRWFRYERTMAGSTVLAGVVATSAEDYNDQLGVTVALPDGTECDDDTFTQSTPARTSAFGALARAGVAGDDVNDVDRACAAASEVYVAVDRGSTSGTTTDLPFVLRVVEEGPLAGSDVGPEAEELVTTGPPTAAAEPADVPGGTSFADAPLLGDGAGATVRDDVRQGAERLWRVHLDWGQTLAASVDLPPRTSTEPAVDPGLSLTLFDPMRNSFDGGAEDRDAEGSYGADGLELFDATPPVRYLNRVAGDGVAYLPGDYWVSVAVAPPADGQAPVEVPVTLAVAVDGDPSGAPTFAEVVTGPGGTKSPAGYSEATPYLVAKGEFAADVSGTPAPPATDGVRRTVGWAVGAASLVSLLAGLVLLARRRRVSRAAAS